MQFIEAEKEYIKISVKFRSMLSWIYDTLKVFYYTTDLFVFTFTKNVKTEVQRIKIFRARLFLKIEVWTQEVVHHENFDFLCINDCLSFRIIQILGRSLE